MSRGRATGAMLLSNQGVVSVAVVALGVLLSVGLLAVTGADLGRALENIEILKVGIDNGLVLPPDIRIVPEITEVLTWSGKRKRVIQEAPE